MTGRPPPLLKLSRKKTKKKIADCTRGRGIRREREKKKSWVRGFVGIIGLGIIEICHAESKELQRDAQWQESDGDELRCGYATVKSKDAQCFLQVHNKPKGPKGPSIKNKNKKEKKQNKKKTTNSENFSIETSLVAAWQLADCVPVCVYYSTTTARPYNSNHHNYN
jgi:hypothetical protein